MEKNSLMDFGKVPPQAIDIEEAVLGALLLEKDSLLEIINIIKPESFYKTCNQIIYKSILSLFEKNKPIDFYTVSEYLKQNNQIDEIGGNLYISSLTNKVASASNIAYHAMVVQEKYINRELIRISTELNQKAYDESIDILEKIENTESNLFNLLQGSISKEPIKIGNIGRSELKRLEKIAQSGSDLSGIPSGFTTLDKITGGFQNNDLIIIAGRPSMGKTTLALTILKNIAFDFNKSVAFFSLEMGIDKIWMKLISSQTSIEVGNLRNAKLEDHEWLSAENAQIKLEDKNIFVDDTPALSVLELKSKAKRLKNKHNIEIIVVDYLQLMRDTENKGNREQEISKISQALKALAKELNIPVIALSQLNRSVEHTGMKKPNLSDLRESGAIEQDADLVIFVYRPEYYGFMEYENQESTVNSVELLIRKHRNGKTGDVILQRDDGFTNIFDKTYINDIDYTNEF